MTKTFPIRGAHLARAVFGLGSLGGVLASAYGCDPVPNPGTPVCEAGAFPQVVTALVPGNSLAQHLAVHEQHAYFLKENINCPRGCSATVSLHRVPLCGGPVENIGAPLSGAISASSTSLHELAVGGGYAYYISSPLARIRIADGTRSTLPIDAACAADMAANSSHVYVYDRCAQRIVRAAHGATTFQVFASAATGTSLALTPSAVFSSRGVAEVWRTPLDGSASTLVWNGGGGAAIVDLAADDSAVIAARSIPSPNGEASITRVPLNGAAPVDLGKALVQPRPGVQSVVAPDITVVEDGNAYFRALNTNNGVELRRAPTSGGPVSTVVRRAPNHFSAAGDRVYWTEEGGLFTALPQPAVPAGTAVDTAPLFARRYDGPGANEIILQIAASPDSSVVGIAYVTGPWSLGGPPQILSGERAAVAKWSADGSHVWSTALGDVGSQAACIGVDPSGIITAVADEFIPEALAIHRLRPDGTPLSVTRQPSDGIGTAECAVDATGAVY
ncbi:MAG TPA: hypothetical protein VK524_07860, partial [Polyangiaceae bacterium]|nr:hypothetical protein [Polyangiaceae bacterium]